VHLVESGPAAGVIGAAFVAGISGCSNLLALDIGGTTAKAALVTGGQPQIAEQFEVGAAAIANVTSPKGLGYPVLTPVISLVEIGAGGGSIAQVDPGGALSVGPQSAGAVPGPACYGQGGEFATLTDANVVLGRIDPDYFLGGQVKLDGSLSEKAIRINVAEPAGLSVIEAAQAVLEIANAKMTSALYFISVEQGIDPRDYVLVPSGGAGPLQAVAIGISLGVPTVLIPPAPGLNSAVGLLASDLKHDVVRTYMKTQAMASPEELSAIYAEMEHGVQKLLGQEGVAPDAIKITCEVEMCYVGQSFRLKMPVPSRIDGSAMDGLTTAFHQKHAEAYGFAAVGEPTQLVNLRLNGMGLVKKPTLRRLPPTDGDVSGAVKRRRRVHFGHREPAIEVDVYDRAKLRAGDRLSGPAIVEQMDTTVVLPPGVKATVESVGSIVVSTGVGGSI
jgi:N-methylhydantoinase A